MQTTRNLSNMKTVKQGQMPRVSLYQHLIFILQAMNYENVTIKTEILNVPHLHEIALVYSSKCTQLLTLCTVLLSCLVSAHSLLFADIWSRGTMRVIQYASITKSIG